MSTISVDSGEFIFRGISKLRNGFKLKGIKPVSYSRLLELLKEDLLPHVSNVSDYGLHSLRAGGATSAANNGIPDRMF